MESAADTDKVHINDQQPSIPNFFSGRDIFITGGTGFMGKVLIEKLLRSCPGINRIFMLIRPKKQMTIDERIQQLIDLPVFDRLREENPKNLKKIIAISGDVCQVGLGLSETSHTEMRNVSVVFHSAASVRFDDPLPEAVIMNTRGTREIMVFCETLQQIKAVVHVSTTYSNPSYRVVNEEIYPPNADWKATIKLAETYPDLLDQLALKYTNYSPNTYTFTKGLAEQVVNDYRHRLPVIIYRPSIVICAMEEPIPGWVDNFNGPVGLLMASGIGNFTCDFEIVNFIFIIIYFLGILRTTYGDPDVVSDFTPVDTSIKAMIVAAWQRATQPQT